MEYSERDGAHISGEQKKYDEQGVETGVVAECKTEDDSSGNESLETKNTGEEKLDDDSAGDKKLEGHTGGDVAVDADMKCYENVLSSIACNDKSDDESESAVNLEAKTTCHERFPASNTGFNNLEDDRAVDVKLEADTEDNENLDEDVAEDDAATKVDEHLTLSPDLIVFQLYYFAKCDRCDKVQEMIYKNGISINANNSKGKNALALAAESSDEDAQKILLENGAVTQLPATLISDVLKNEPLQDVCVRQVFEAACLEDSFPEFLSVVLNEGGIDINEVNADGQSALMLAVETHEFTAVTVLLAAGAIVSEQVVKRALDLKDFEILEVLLGSGPTLCDSLWLELLQLPFLCAAHRALVESEQKSKCHFTETPLARAVRLRSLEAVSRLIEAGVDVNMTDSDGRTALHAAVIRGDVEILKVLIGNGADVNIQDSTFNTPLDLALNCDNILVEVIQELQLAGAISGSNIQGDQNKNLRDIKANQETVTENDFVSYKFQSHHNAIEKKVQDSCVDNLGQDSCVDNLCQGSCVDNLGQEHCINKVDHESVLDNQANGRPVENQEQEHCIDEVNFDSVLDHQAKTMDHNSDVDNQAILVDHDSVVDHQTNNTDNVDGV